jgi:putative ABC transport system substrate-binding protein
MPRRVLLSARLRKSKNVRWLVVLAVLFGTFATPAAARAQATKRTPTVGVLATTGTESGSVRIQALKQSLRESGWVEGETVRFEMRFAEGRSERFPEQAAELVRLKVDVIVASGSQATKAAIEATRTIPTVFVAVSHPIEAGFVQSLARPGGNVTGVTNQFSDLHEKHLQLAREVVPRLRHVGIMWTPVDPGSARGFKDARDRYSSLGIKVTSAPVRSPIDFEAAFEILSRERPDFLMVHPTPVISQNRQRVAEFALRKRLPTITGFQAMVEDGSVMMSYGPNLADLFRQAGLYVNKILRGARPPDLPVEQPTRFELVVNRRVAKAIGLELTPGFLARADQAIE